MEKELIRVVLDDGTRRDFNLSRVFTNSDMRYLVTDILIFVKSRPHSIHSWYQVKEGEVTDGIPNEKR